ncbi:MAG: PilC/PilY family type IV pilus protein [Gammaproteobacteria bacterium]|nr:PilC/PilY family type IV pilus protein [Gammaproteobacteria bacterium]
MKGKAFQKVIKQSALSLLVFFAGNTNSYAGSVDIAQTPLFLGAGVQPNIFFVSDDSGSMDWETMMPGYWRYDAYDPDRLRQGTFADFGATWLDNGTWEAAVFNGTDDTDGAYGYIYGRSGGSTDNVYSNDCDGSYYRGYAEECGDTTDSPFDVDWRVRSSGLNKVFYNADITYQPWSGPCGSGDCADASFTSVRSDPYTTQPGYSITRDLATDGDAQGGPFVYDVWIDDSGFTGGHPDSGPDFNETGYAASALATGAAGLAADLPNGMVDLWDSHMRFAVGAGSVNVQLITYNPVPVAGATEGLNKNNSFLNTNLSNSSCYNVLGTDAMVKNIRDQIITDPANAVTHASATGADGCRTIVEVQQNAANWFQYYRRRAFPVKNAVAAVIDAQPNFRYGMTLLNENSTSTGDIFIEVPAGGTANVAPHNLSIKDAYFSYRQESNGTPLRNALKMAGRYYSGSLTGKVDPIKYSCQKNFTILFTDGYWSGTSPSVGDVDNDGVSNTVADVAYLYYGAGSLTGDIYPSMDNNVQVDLPVEADMPTFNPPDNDRTYQHMVTFTVAFGVNGKLVDADNDGVPDVRYDGNPWATGDLTDIKRGDGSSSGWGPASTGPDKIDDLWHAAYNSGGTYASAATPDEITDKLIKAISNIEKRQSSAAAVALNSGTLNANSRVYQAGFNSSNWSGSLRSIPIQDGPIDENPADGNDDSPAECDPYPTLGELCIDFNDPNDVGEWDAAKKLEVRSASSRDIYSFSADNNAGIVFNTIADLDVSQQTALRTHPDTSAVEALTVGQQRLDYIRGDNANEGSAATNFRVRMAVATGSSKLGDIIHSAPAFVGKPDFFYPDNLEATSYNAFKIAHANRPGVVYVGANDGMLHAFDASNTSSKGDELFAYAPGKLISKLPQLTSQTYNQRHTYFVDGSPVAFDAYDGGWKTLLAGSAGAGGQLVFGLDVTDPYSAGFDESNMLWEFTDEPRVVAGNTFGDVDLGYTIGDVAYGRMNNGKWVAIFGNGFNNTEADGNPSLTGNAVIYVVDAFTGALIKKFDTQAGMAEDPTGANRPNGISRVTPIDTNGDFKVDYLYAGDLFGNAWKMDVSSSSDASWSSAYSAAGKPKPFYIAKDASGVEQAITTAMSVKRHPVKVDETLVLFGTGSYLAVNDSTTVQTQTFYSIWDDGTAAQYPRSSLLEQEILNVQTITGTDGIDRDFRVTSSADVDPASYKIDWSTDKGWFMDLGFGADVGERVNVEPILRGNRIIFVTLTPDPDPCNYGGTSWIMEVNANDGSRLKQSPFDVNGDGIIDDLDVVSFGGDDETVTSGVRSKEGIVAKPGILNTKGKKELKFLSGTSGKIDTVTESINENLRDRQSWRQLR